jgi:AcrR family transcriptional regulator
LDRFDNTSKDRGNTKRRVKLERVLSIASELFASSDYQGVCMEEIAQRSGVGKGTLYNLFESKEDLYFSILRRRLEELLDILERAYNSREDTLRNLRSLILHLHKFMSKHPHFYLIWKREENSLAKNDRLGIGRLYRRLNDLVLRVLQRGTREGIIRPEMNHELIAHLLLGMIDGLRKSLETVYQREKAIDDLLTVLMKGIGVEELDVRVTYDSYQHLRSADER